MSIIASSHFTIIVGLGVTGLSAARFLQEQGMLFAVMDSRQTPPNLSQFENEFPDVKVITGDLDEDFLAEASEIIISPGMSLQTPALRKAQQAGVSIIGDIELFARHASKPVIAITGSNAKSTVTSLVGDMVKAAGYRVAVGGNLGKPVLELLDDNHIDFYVLELSSFQLETTFSLQPIAATILNLSEDHMDRYASYGDYHRAKQRIYHNAQHVVVNRQDMLTHPPLGNDVTLWSFGNDTPDIRGFGLQVEDNRYFLTYQFTPMLAADQLTVKGMHNVINALAALALTTAAGIDPNAVLQALVSFKGLPHRCEFIADINQVSYINDSKATNVGATLAALQGFASASSPNIILIAGGQSKDADFSPLKNALKKHVRLLILIGRDAPKIEKVMSGIVPMTHVASIQEAVGVAKDNAQQGNIVLLSPACASFDMFSGFAERGQQFAAAVQELAA